MEINRSYIKWNCSYARKCPKMVFSSFEFLFRFLPVFLFLYYITPLKWKNHILFAGSLIFYTLGEAWYVLLLLASVVVNYLFGCLICRLPGGERKGRRKAALILALGYDFGMLFFYKYSGFSDELPLGISFYTFQIAAYIIDVYRGKIPAERSFVRLGTYLTMFPQLVAGPIINYSEVREALGERKMTMGQFESGLCLLTFGLGAKVILADRVGLLWNSIQTIGFLSISTPLAWLGVYAYALELYFDFAGYSLMARGLGRMLGFEIPENFRYPYMARSVSEFWRRWHITLGRWFREYVYFPLGGSLGGRAKTCRNLLIVWSLTALWHGADANYLIWGASLVLLLAAEKLLLFRYLDRSRVLSHVYLLILVPLTWAVFAVTDIGQLGIYFSRLFPVFSQEGTWRNMDFLPYLKDYGPLFVLGALFATPIPEMLYKRLEKRWIGGAAVAAVLFLSLYYMTISANNPFLYFNF